MRLSHSFFISEEKYLTNLEGLLKYLAEKINIGLLCIYCDNQGTKGFKSGSAVRNHMVIWILKNFYELKINKQIDKSHCFMNSDYFDEYEEFFDFGGQSCLREQSQRANARPHPQSISERQMRCLIFPPAIP